jgi:hypothetical protein
VRVYHFLSGPVFIPLEGAPFLFCYYRSLYFPVFRYMPFLTCVCLVGLESGHCTILYHALPYRHLSGAVWRGHNREMKEVYTPTGPFEEETIVISPFSPHRNVSCVCLSVQERSSKKELKVGDARLSGLVTFLVVFALLLGFTLLGSSYMMPRYGEGTLYFLPIFNA